MATPFSNPAASLGAASGDFDADVRLDLMNLTVLSENARLYRNLGNLEFETLNPIPNFARPNGAHAIAIADYDNDGWLDIVMSRDRFTNPKTGESSNFLFRNNGDGSFSRADENAIISDTGDSQSANWADIDNDGLAPGFLRVLRAFVVDFEVVEKRLNSIQFMSRHAIL